MLIRNLRLIDGAGDIRDGVDVRIRDGRFAEIGPGLDGDGSEEVDAGGATAMPGLIDAHTHLTMDVHARGARQRARPAARRAGGSRGAARRGAARQRRHDSARGRRGGPPQPRPARLDRLGRGAGAAPLHGGGMDDRPGRPRLARRPARRRPRVGPASGPAAARRRRRPAQDDGLRWRDRHRPRARHRAVQRGGGLDRHLDGPRRGQARGRARPRRAQHPQRRPRRRRHRRARLVPSRPS